MIKQFPVFGSRFAFKSKRSTISSKLETVNFLRIRVSSPGSRIQSLAFSKPLTVNRFLNRRGVSDWIQNIVSLLLAGIGLLILFLFVISQFGILTGGNRSEDAARVALKSFALELDSVAVSPDDHFLKRNVQRVGESYMIVFFRGGVEGAHGSAFIESFDSESLLVLEKPYYCGDSPCLCVYHGSEKNRGWSELAEMWTEILTDWWVDIPKELIECSTVKSDYIFTYSPPISSVQASKSLRAVASSEYLKPLRTVSISKDGGIFRVLLNGGQTKFHITKDVDKLFLRYQGRPLYPPKISVFTISTDESVIIDSSMRNTDKGTEFFNSAELDDISSFLDDPEVLTALKEAIKKYFSEGGDTESSTTMIGDNERNTFIPVDEISQELPQELRSKRDESFRPFTSRGFYFYSSSDTSRNELPGYYYAEKIVHNGNIYLLVIPESSYTEARANVFQDVYDDPVETLKKYISESNDDKVISYGRKHFVDILNSYNSLNDNNRQVRTDLLERFSKEYLSYLKDDLDSPIISDTKSPMRVDEGARIVRILLDSVDEEFVRYEATSFFEDAIKVRIGAKGVLEVLDAKEIDGVKTSKYDLYVSSINSVKSFKPSDYSMINNIVSNPRFWGTVLRGHDQESPQLLFKKLLSLPATSVGIERQRAFYLLGLAYRNYDFREGVDSSTGVEISKRKYAESVKAFKDAEVIDPTNDIAVLARDERSKVCALGRDSIGDDGVAACAS